MTYKISLLTFKIYDENLNEIIFDSNNQDYLDYLSWLDLGNDPEEFEGTEEEILFSKQDEINAIKNEYDGYLLELSQIHVIKFTMAQIPIPAAVLAEYSRLVLECNDKIKEIIPTATYSRTPNSTIKK